MCWVNYLLNSLTRIRQLGAVQSQLKSNLPAQKLSTRRRMQTAKKKAVEAGGGVSRMSEDINFSCHPATKTTETMVVGSLKAKDLKISGAYSMNSLAISDNG